MMLKSFITDQIKIRPHWIAVIPVFISVVLISCESSDKKINFENKSYEAIVKPDAATLDMIQKVEATYTKVDPEEVDYVLNNQRSEQLEQKLKETEPGGQRNLLVYNYGVELLKAGKTDEAIGVFENFYSFYKDNEMRNKEEAMAEFGTQLAISYLRKAEQENCILNHNNESCIIPMSKKAQHINKEGSTKAIEYLEKLIVYNPEDYGMQYLLNIAYMTLGGYPDDVPKEYLIPEAYFNQNEFTKFQDVAMDLGVDVNEISGGICLDDFNNDGFLDIMVSSWGFKNQIRYFENDTKGGFTDKTSFTGLVGVTGGLNLKHADYNNDGNLDFIILRGAWLEDYGNIPNSLIRNNGDGTFTDVTVEAGILSPKPTQTAIWSDFNLDGWLDIFIANESTEKGDNNCELFVNNGDGTFKDVGQTAGLSEKGFFKGVDSGDLNNDGYPDLYISNFNGKNLLYMNSGEAQELSFKLAGDSVAVSNPLRSFSTWIFDYNNDGFEDIFVSGYSYQHKSPIRLMMLAIKDEKDGRLDQHRPILYRNNGDGTFTNVSVEMGLNEPVTTMGCNFGDLDNDGFLDFYLATGDPSLMSIVPNKMYRNNGGTSFEDVTYSGGFGHIQKGHAVGFGDLDMDGDQDIYAVMGGAYEGDVFQNVLFENPIGNKNNWINIVLEGTTSNRSAIGARIIATLIENDKERKVYHTVGTGASFGGNSLMAEIGLGQAVTIQKLEIIWPIHTQEKSIFNNVSVNRLVKIKQGSDEIISLNIEPVPFSKSEHAHH